MPSSGIILALCSLACKCYTWLKSGYFSSIAKLQRPIAPKRVVVPSHKLYLLELVAFSLSNGASLMIPAHFIMELQPLKHTLLPPAILYCHFGLPWLLAAKAPGLQIPQMSLQPSRIFTDYGSSVCSLFFR